MYNLKHCANVLSRRFHEWQKNRQLRAKARAYLAFTTQARIRVEARLQELEVLKHDLQQHRKRFGNSNALRFRVRELRLAKQLLATEIRCLAHYEEITRQCVLYYA